MRYRSLKYFYVAAFLLFVGNLLGSCVVFLQIRDTTHFFLVNPLSFVMSRKNSECYRKRNENHLNITRASFFSRQAFFFHSTSCNKMLEEHGACAIEAAARLHPDSEVNLLYSSPVSRSTWSGHLDQLVKLNNFRIIGIHIESYADGTEFEAFWKNVVSHNKVEGDKDVAEYVKFLTLHKYGGTVLDLDVILNKPLDVLGGIWLTKDGRGSLATDVISILRSNLGRNVTGNILRILSAQILNGGIKSGEALTTVVKALCPGQDFHKKTNTCHGFEILENKLFHPISYENREKFYRSGEYDKRAYAHRLWDIDHSENVINQRTLYADLAQTFCPSVYSKIHTDYYNN